MAQEILPDLKDKGSGSKDLSGAQRNEWEEPHTKVYHPETSEI